MIREGNDPLGEAFTRIRPANQRRLLGATYTPSEIVSSMAAWIASQGKPSRVVDPGTGSAKFLLAAGRARRPPVFVRNKAAAGHINVAHGIYPREPLTEPTLDALAAALCAAGPAVVGRTCAGGLVKFEPSEMARIHIPAPEMLEATAA